MLRFRPTQHVHPSLHLCLHLHLYLHSHSHLYLRLRLYLRLYLHVHLLQAWAPAVTLGWQGRWGEAKAWVSAMT